MPDSRSREVSGNGARIGRELAVEIAQVSPIAVVDVRGDVVASTVPLLRAVLGTAVAAGVATVEVNLMEVRFLDSDGFMALVDAQRACLVRGKAFALRGVSPATRHLLAAAGGRSDSGHQGMPGLGTQLTSRDVETWALSAHGQLTTEEVDPSRTRPVESVSEQPV